MTAEKAISATPAATINPAIIDGVEVSIEAYLGGAALTIGELAAVRAGAVVPLSSRLGQDVELRLNGVTIATGELVSVGDNFAVRISDIAQS